MAAYQGTQIGFVVNGPLSAGVEAPEEMAVVPVAALAQAQNYIQHLEQQVARMAAANFRPVTFYRMALQQQQKAGAA